MYIKIIIFSLLITIYTNTAFADEALNDNPSNNQPSHYTGFYTNLSLHKASYDLLGIEVFIVKAKGSFYLIFQSAQGSPGIPKVVPVTITSNKISFTLPDDEVDYEGKFEGIIDSDKIVGSFLNGQGKKNMVLLKAKSYWENYSKSNQRQ